VGPRYTLSLPRAKEVPVDAEFGLLGVGREVGPNLRVLAPRSVAHWGEGAPVLRRFSFLRRVAVTFWVQEGYWNCGRLPWAGNPCKSPRRHNWRHPILRGSPIVTQLGRGFHAPMRPVYPVTFVAGFSCLPMPYSSRLCRLPIFPPLLTPPGPFLPYCDALNQSLPAMYLSLTLVFFPRSL